MAVQHKRPNETITIHFRPTTDPKTGVITGRKRPWIAKRKGTGGGGEQWVVDQGNKGFWFIIWCNNSAQFVMFQRFTPGGRLKGYWKPHQLDVERVEFPDSGAWTPHHPPKEGTEG